MEAGGEGHGTFAVGVFADLEQYHSILESEDESRDGKKQRHCSEDRYDLVVGVEVGADLSEPYHDSQVYRLAATLPYTVGCESHIVEGSQ